MFNILNIIENAVVKAVNELYGVSISPDKVSINTTRKEFEGDYTIVVFPFVKMARKKPEMVGEEIGQYITANTAEINSFNVIKGFLNLVVDNSFWGGFLDGIYQNVDYGRSTPNGKKVMVEFSSPNTNKPLHLGHIRNILLGWASSKLFEAAGYEVVKVQIVNDRGIAICKSMLAWEKFGEGATPSSTGIKGDHFVGKYYVLFEKKFQEEYKNWQHTEDGKKVFEEWKNNEKELKKATKIVEDAKEKARKKSEEARRVAEEAEDKTALENLKPFDPNSFTVEKHFYKEVYKNKYFNNISTLGKEAKAMLIKWEEGDEYTVGLWNKMNAWVYEGFEKTYQKLGVNFDKLYYESNTYLLGKNVVQRGLSSDIFYQKEDNSVWIDLEEAKLDHKLVLRSDGTSVYMTQDIGTAMVRYEDFKVDRMVYVVADEQNYHFQVLFEIMKRLQEPYADGLYHLSYGMVDLPSGKMKSREGTVVDADDLVAEVVGEAKANSLERGTLDELSTEEQEEIFRKIGLSALKFFIIKVAPKKRMTFDPKESVDMQGQTGPYVQNAYVRVRSVLRKAAGLNIDMNSGEAHLDLAPLEKELLVALYEFPELIKQSAEAYDPSAIANY